MGDWIQINMRWGDGDTLIEDQEREEKILKLYDEIDLKTKNHFGKNSEEEEKELYIFLKPWLEKNNTDDISDFIDYAIDKYEFLKDKQLGDLWLKNIEEKTKDPFVIRLAEYWDFCRKEREWSRNLYENELVFKLMNERYKKGFTSSDMNKPGTIIEVQNEDEKIEQYIIGDINTNGGLCDCCSINDNVIVLRYKNLLD